MAKLSTLIGLPNLKSSARMQILACRNHGEVFPHSLLTGLGGTGKTEFARAIGDELGYHFVETHAAAYKHRDSLFSAFLDAWHCSHNRGVPLLYFIDEIHRLKPLLQEAFYSVLKEWWIPSSEGRIDISPFTLIGATTRLDMLDGNSFLTRFENVWEFSRYKDEEIGIIIAQNLSKHGLRFSSEITAEIAKRSLGIPRNAMNLSKKVRLMTLSHGRTEVLLSDVHAVFNLEEIDEIGLRPIHRAYLKILFNSKEGEHYLPVGVGIIAAKMRQSQDLIEGSVEPLLLELDLITAGSRGRVLTKAGSIFFAKRA